MSAAATGSHIIRHIELYLTGVGLLLILVVPQLFSAEQRMTALAITAVLVGVVHGLLFWLVRRRQRQVREALIEDLRGMLKDRINNKLQILLLHGGHEAPADGVEREARLREVSTAVEEVSELLERLSLESLTAWRSRYGITARPH